MCAMVNGGLLNGRRVQYKQASVVPKRRICVIVAHAPGGQAATLDKKSGFIGELRSYAMKLHTKEQAPKEGGVEPPKQMTWTPTREGYLKFLAESKAVYDTMEKIIAEGKKPEYAQLQSSGIERGDVIIKDLKWFEEKYHLPAPKLLEDGPGLSYSKFLQELSERSAPAFVCHYYNHYFAHHAGGKMIGAKISSMLLDNATLEVYKYPDNVSELLDAVRTKINGMAANWSEAEKQACLEETAATFKYAGSLMRCITSA